MPTEPLETEPSTSLVDVPRRRGLGTAPAVFLAVLVLFIGVTGWWIGRSDGDSFNDVDVGFLSDMGVHHQGAISLGFDYLRRESDPLVGHFAREIILLQSQQIATMNILLDEAGEPDQASDDIVMEWMGEPVTSERMPGLATLGEYEELRGAQGLAADDVFTRLMIRHHTAGAIMARYAAEHGSNQKVREFAAKTADAQKTEIVEMNNRREQLGLAPVDVTDLIDAMHH